MSQIGPSGIIAIPGFSEPFSSMSHLFATGPFAIWGYFLLRLSARRQGAWQRAPWLLIFIFSTLFLLSMSGVYHMLDPGGTPRAVLQRLDHAAIFVLIAGTFTAAHGILFRGIWRWGMLLLIWALAITAITLGTIFFVAMPEILSLALYLGLGWLGLVSGIKMVRVFGLASIRWLLAGALAYSFGAVGEFLHWPILIPGVVQWHEVFHLMVLLGLACHWRFVQDFVVNPPRPLKSMDQSPQALAVEKHIRKAVPVSPWYDFKVEAVTPECARSRLLFNTKLLRPGGSISGPAMMALVDATFYALLLGADVDDLEHAQHAVTTDLNFHFLRRPKPGDLLAEARLLKRGRRLAVAEVLVSSAVDGALVLKASGTYALASAVPSAS